jgi:polyphosphate kinase
MTPSVNRDISWLDFNYRVLQECKDKRVPLLERVKFLAIYSSNLEEFFRIRVANHRNLLRIGRKTAKNIAYDPKEILTQIQKIVSQQQVEFSRIFFKEIVPELAKHHIKISTVRKLNKRQTDFIEKYFNQQVVPYVDPIFLFDHKIKPFLNNGELYLVIQLLDPETSATHYALTIVPTNILPRFIEIPAKEEDTREIMFLDDIIRHNLHVFFPGFVIQSSYSIKLTRDAELYIDDEYSGDLLAKIKSGLIKRNIGTASRLVFDREMPEKLIKYLMHTFDISTYDLLPEGRYHNNSDFFRFPDFGLNHLKNPPLPPVPVYTLERSVNIFDKISNSDFLVYPPFHSYESVIKFFEDAASDISVTHIKIIQYRVAKVSRIMEALKLAVKNGKQVSAFIEVKARFDEEANIQWGEALEKAGVQVFYSIPGYKVHAKMSVVRRIEDGLPKIYTYFSTGNFHEDTAKIYSDVGIFTADTRLTDEATRIFSFLESATKPIKPFAHLGVGLFGLKEKLKSLIENECRIATEGRKAEMILKMNSLQDPEMIDLLYKASQKGVKITLIVRGICCLVPGIKDVSDNIEAFSIVDKYLEHSRIFIFHNEGKEDMYISSADWMVRNLHYRIETLVPVFNEPIKKIIRTTIKFQMNENVKARIIGLNNNNNYRSTQSDLAVRSQIDTYYYLKRIAEQENFELK